jgi:hypothetical protein
MAYTFPIYKSIPHLLEFLELKDEEGKIDKPFNTEIWPGLHGILQPSSIQLFVSRIFNLLMEHKRLVLAMATGTGKSLTSILCAGNFKQTFINQNSTSRVIVISFTADIFKREILLFQELGFITHAELKELNKLRTQKIITKDPEHIKLYKNKYNEFKRRITDTNNGGYFIFYGYKELINALIEIDTDISTYKPKELYAKLKEGSLVIKMGLLELFKNSVVICDEIHVSYNSIEKNNYGIVIQYILDYYKNDIYALFLSATIINNNPREIIDIANLMTIDNKFDVDNYFEYENVQSIKSSEEEIIIQEKEDKIISDLSDILNVFKGRIIVYEEENKNYPSYEYMGQEIIPGLRLTLCEMSPLHQQTFNFTSLYISSNGLERCINDIVFPNPDFPDVDYNDFHPDIYYKLSASKKKELSRVYGLYKSEEIKQKIGNASNEWKHKVGIEIKKEGINSFLTGPFLKKENIRIYSNKLYELLLIIEKVREENPNSKIFIFHPYVQVFGTLLIRELLYYNGFLNEYGVPNDSTYIVGLNKKFGDIPKLDWDKYKPARYISSYNFAPESKEIILEKFNDSSNSTAEIFQILNASKIMYQSSTLKDTHVCIILQLLNNYSSEIQVYGRGRRNGSHINLPPNQRYIKYYTLCSSTNIKMVPNNPDSNELSIRKRKFATYNVIRDLYKKINEYALNNFTSLPNLEYKQIDLMRNLSYKDKLYKKYNSNIEVSDVTYRAYDYYNEDTKNMLFLLRRLFYTNPVWHIKQIQTFIKNIPFNIPYNFSNTLDKSNILDICLFYLSYNNTEISISNLNNIYFNPYIKLFNQEYRNGKMVNTNLRIIVNIGDYFILTPIINGKIKLDTNCFFNRKHVNNKIDIEIKPHKENNKYILIYEKFMEDYKMLDNTKDFIYNSLRFYPLEYHDNILKLYIENKIDIPKDLKKLYKDLGILKKNKYISLLDTYMYDEGDFWNIKPKILTYIPENKVLIGYIRDEKFKIRYPIGSKTTKDIRTINKGIACETLKKENIDAYIKNTNFKINKSKNNKTRDICQTLYNSLLELEIKSRKEKENIRFLYLYNDNLPVLK